MLTHSFYLCKRSGTTQLIFHQRYFTQLYQDTQQEFIFNFHAIHSMPCASKIILNLLAQKLLIKQYDEIILGLLLYKYVNRLSKKRFQLIWFMWLDNLDTIRRYYPNLYVCLPFNIETNCWEKKKERYSLCFTNIVHENLFVFLLSLAHSSYST